MGRFTTTGWERQRRYRAKLAETRKEEKEAFELLTKLNAAVYTAEQSNRLPSGIFEQCQPAATIQNLTEYFSGQQQLFEVEKTNRRAPKKSAAK